MALASLLTPDPSPVCATGTTRVIFAIKAEGPSPTLPSQDSIKAVTWTNADGTPGRIDVTQKNFTGLELQG